MPRGLVSLPTPVKRGSNEAIVVKQPILTCVYRDISSSYEAFINVTIEVANNARHHARWSLTTTIQTQASGSLRIEQAGLDDVPVKLPTHYQAPSCQH